MRRGTDIAGSLWHLVNVRELGLEGHTCVEGFTEAPIARMEPGIEAEIGPDVPGAWLCEASRYRL